MKTVPSLVATSTVGIAAAGLALGKPESTTSPSRPTSKKRKATDGEIKFNLSANPLIARPATSSIIITPDRPTGSAYGSSSASGPTLGFPRVSSTIFEDRPSGTARRATVGRHAEPSPQQELGADDARESISSRGSWMRRLSTIQLSRDNSPRSSLGPDSPSFSNSSGAPIWLNGSSGSAPLPPNKLVKRTTSGKMHGGTRARSGTSPQLPTLRRPATSHQRSFTLQQEQLKRENLVTAKDQEAASSPIPLDHAGSKTKPASLEPNHTWRPFFEARPTKLSKERTSGRSGEGNMQGSSSVAKRVIPHGSVHPTLIRPTMITTSGRAVENNVDEESLPLEEEDEEEEVEINPEEVVPEHVLPTTEMIEPRKRVRRAMSINFSSPTSWISRSSSLRGNKRTTDGKPGGKRYSSAPVSTLPGRDIVSAHSHVTNGHRSSLDPAVFSKQAQTAVASTNSDDPFSLTSLQSRNRNSSSPLPPLSRLSSFNVDLARLGLSSSSSSAPRSPNLHNNTTAASLSSGRMSPSSASYFTSLNVKGPRTSELTDQASTLIGSDNEGKVFFGDEEDTDFQSETVYDSLRTATTGSIRSHNAPLEYMFDESPPSIGGHSKKRLSIHEMLGNGSFGEGNKIVEEDEGMPTPVKANRSRTSQDGGFRTPVHKAVDADKPFQSSPPNFSLASKDLNGLSLDDGPEEEEDWNKDDENAEFGSPLSPPSHPSSSINSRRVDASFRAALADVTLANSPNSKSNPPAEPLRNNLFDWSEPSTMENPARPSTAYAKHILDGRGGRAMGRRGPTALHIRSQSVPVVPDLANQREAAKGTQKFGTWGLGAKGVSEDWDGDFDFESPESDDADEGTCKMENSGMFVPPAIQASQASVVGHVGQIREVCLLVEDLKRLRILGREKNLLNGPAAPIWKEAEGIIALAVPDEEDLALSPPRSPMSKDMDAESIDEKYTDHGLDASEISHPDEPFEVLNHQGRPTGYAYDGSHVRRRSVFSPEDDIFGAGAEMSEAGLQRPKPLTRATSPVIRSTKKSAEVARSVMETIHQHRSTSDPLLPEIPAQSLKKMPFDTTSLRDLVHRASIIRGTLSEIVRRADGMSPSPDVSPRRDSSPAFTRVFTDPMASPPKHLPRSQSNNSMLGGSIDSSPSRSLGQRMHMMTVV
ncbi:hypothetical protein PVAG01_07301 [Phlyctema vagabunda]|uniref:Uncharacterized protein n=1 Tax=Phlyctema vagabunda TaxID=108571 RepID=A0ABR4PC06_9HELO